MRYFQHTLLILALSFTLALAACSGEQPVEKTIIGTWVQDTPTSMTANGLQTTTADTVLRLKKNGEVHLTRNLDIAARDLPEGGIKLGIELRGKWEIIGGQLKQAQDSALIIPRSSDDISRKWADELQAQADESRPTVKDIISVDKKQLILQDTDNGTTDIYRRK